MEDEEKEKMTEQDRLTGLLRRVSGTGGKVVNDDGTLFGSGTLIYSELEGSSGLYVGERKIPLERVVDVCPGNGGYRPTIYLNSNDKPAEAQAN